VEEFDNSRLISEFNECKFQIFRLHDSWETIKRHIRAGNLIDWNTELDIIFLELTTDQEIALYAEAEGLDKVGRYLRNKGDIIPATSMSRKGFFIEAIITQIKKEKKIGEPKDKKGGWWFAKKKTGEEE